MIGSNSAPEALPPHAMRRNLRQLGSDVMTLLELQAELLQVDMREWLKACFAPIALLLVAALLGLASFPVLLLSLAYALEHFTTLSMATCLLASAAAGLITAGGCFAVAIRLLRRDAQILSRSSGELRRNVRWLKEVLTSPSSSASPK